MVPGHEIVGIVRAVGSEVTRFAIGDRVGVGVFVDSCRTCPDCLLSKQQFCSTGFIGTYNAKAKCECSFILISKSCIFLSQPLLHACSI